MPRIYIYIGHIIATSVALLCVKMFCVWYLYYFERPILLTLAGMNILLGLILFRKESLKEQVVACGLVTLLIIGIYITYHSSLIAGETDLSQISFRFPTLIFFAATIGYWELALELKRRKVF